MFNYIKRSKYFEGGNNGFYPHLILILTSNIDIDTINLKDPSFLK